MAAALPAFCLAFADCVFLFVAFAILILFSSCHPTKSNYTGCAPPKTMEPQRINDIKKSLHDMTMEELQEMSDDLGNLIAVLVTRQVAIEDTILDRLEAAFSK